MQPVRERTVIIPLDEVVKPQMETRGRPAKLPPATAIQRWFVSFETNNPKVPRLEAHALARTKEEAAEIVLGLIGAPVLLTMEVD